MFLFLIWDDNDKLLGNYETTCLKYAERYARETFSNYSYITRSL